MAMGAATATNGDATPVDSPGRRMYANGGEEKKNGASLHHKHQHSSRSSDDDDVPDLVENFDEASKGEEKVKSEGK